MYAIQQRLLWRGDKRFAALQFVLLNEMAIKWKDYSRFISLDDKAIAPV